MIYSVSWAVIAESTPLEKIVSGKSSSHCRYFKMKVLESHKATEMESLMKGSLDPKTVVLSDKSRSYFNIEDYVEAHIIIKSNKKITVEVLKWAHIAISKAKKNFLGIFIYYRIKSIFERLVVASVYPYWQTTE